MYISESCMFWVVCLACSWPAPLPSTDVTYRNQKRSQQKNRDLRVSCLPKGDAVPTKSSTPQPADASSDPAKSEGNCWTNAQKACARPLKTAQKLPSAVAILLRLRLTQSRPVVLVTGNDTRVLTQVLTRVLTLLVLQVFLPVPASSFRAACSATRRWPASA